MDLALTAFNYSSNKKHIIISLDADCIVENNYLSAIINALKYLAGLPDEMHLLPTNIVDSLAFLKKDILKRKRVSLDLDETIIALSISGTSNTAAQMAIKNLKELKGCEVHTTHIPTPGDEAGFRKLGVNLTSDPDFSSKNLFVS